MALTLQEIQHAVRDALRCGPDVVVDRSKGAQGPGESYLITVRGRVHWQIDAQGPVFGAWFVTIRDLGLIQDHATAQYTLKHVIQGPEKQGLERALFDCALRLVTKLGRLSARLKTTALDAGEMLRSCPKPDPLTKDDEG